MKYEELRVGQKVKIVRCCASCTERGSCYWRDSMDGYVCDGNQHTISQLHYNQGVKLEEDKQELAENINKEVNTIITQVSVFRKGLNPIYGEGTTHIRIEDEAAGPFIILSQNDQEIRLDEDEIQVIADAALKLLADSKFYFKEN